MGTFFRSAATTVLVYLFSAGAYAGMIWTPSDLQDVRTVNLLQIAPIGATLNGGILAIFEDTDDMTDANALVVGDKGGLLEFTDNQDGTYTAKVSFGGVVTGSINMLGDEFKFGVNWGNGYVEDDSTSPGGADPTSVFLGFTDGLNSGHTLVVDVRAPQQVSLPATLFLIAPFALGLLRWRSRKAA